MAKISALEPFLTSGELADDDLLYIAKYVSEGVFDSAAVRVGDLKTKVNTDPTTVPSSEPHLGALVGRSSSITVSTGTIISWQTEIYDTSGCWNIANPTRLVVPAGWTKIRLTGSAALASAAATANPNLTFLKNGNFIDQGVTRSSDVQGNSNTAVWLSAHSAVLEVEEGDYFELRVFPAVSRTLDSGTTWASIECVERSI